MRRADLDYPPNPDLNGPCPTTRRSFLALMASLISPSASAQDDVKDRDKLARRLESMRRLAKEVKICEITDGTPGPPLVLRPDPLLRYTNPTLRVVDGTLWCWGQGGRPAAVMKLAFRGPTRGQRNWGYRVNVLSSKQLEVTFGDGESWLSRKPGLELRPLSDAPAPADSAAQRLLQAKEFARRLSVSAQPPFQTGRTQYRLMPRPIDRYSAPPAGPLDGFLFSFVYTNNPSTLLVLEAWSEGSGGTWRFALVRQGAGEQTALLDGKLVWSISADPQPADAGLFVAQQKPVSPEEQD